VLAHIRKATQGRVALDNCHPFLREWRGRHWTFCHNGDLKGFHPEFTGPFLPVGDTDSERAFCWLLQRLRERLALATSSDSDSGPAATQWPVLAPLLGELAADVARCGPFNFLLSDGQALYAYGATRLHWLSRQHPFSTAHLVDSELSLDLASVNSPNDRMVLVATEPLTSNEPWLPFGTGELMVFAAGQAVWSSRPTARALDGEERPAELDNTPRHLVCPA
jgi:glutamine amidotransferase